ncbi:sensor histidine kinase, partial [Candidatus Omnitrophota bacterium]
NETDRATVITKKLSSFAKPSPGIMTDNVDVEKELEKVISLVEYDLKLDNIAISKEIEGDLPPISADKKQLQEIFFNIIRNAAQSIKHKGKIILRAYCSNKRIYIDIEDTGEGMSKGHLAQIFNPFFTTKDPGEGTGLGLFIVKQIVERNKGRIAVKSEPGKGTTFYLRFDTVLDGESDTSEKKDSITTERD